MFDLNEKEKNKLIEWIKIHDEECPFSHINSYKNVYKLVAIGGRISYIFTPTGVGTTIEAKCSCNKGNYSIDLTDYDSW